MKDIDKVKAKIKKLFALSKSPNANEAAAALEKAQKLLEDYGLEWDEADQIAVTKESTEGNSGKRPPLYEAWLISAIARSFGCNVAYGFACYDNRYNPHYQYEFVGVEHRAVIAAYLAKVLLRKVKKARAAHLKTLTKVRTRSAKMKRADMFCKGWVAQVTNKLCEFTNTPKEEKAIEKYMAGQLYSGNITPRTRGSVRSGENDFAAGARAGSGVELQHGVGGKENGVRLLGGAR